MSGDERLPDSYFDELYRNDADPWRLSEGFYERRKRELILAVLPRPRFASCFEPGCALGLNTVELAKRCDRVLATDVNESALETTRDRVRSFAHVKTARAAVPDDWPDGRFELVVLSEVGYYVQKLTALAIGLHTALADDGVLIACHWRHPAPDYPSDAQQVHDAVGAGLHRLTHMEEEDFLLDVWSRDSTSVARRAGLLT